MNPKGRFLQMKPHTGYSLLSRSFLVCLCMILGWTKTKTFFPLCALVARLCGQLGRFPLTSCLVAIIGRERKSLPWCWVLILSLWSLVFGRGALRTCPCIVEVFTRGCPLTVYSICAGKLMLRNLYFLCFWALKACKKFRYKVVACFFFLVKLHGFFLVASFVQSRQKLPLVTTLPLVKLKMKVILPACSTSC